MKCENCPYWEMETCSFDPNANWDPPCDAPEPDPVRYTVFLLKGDEVQELEDLDYEIYMIGRALLDGYGKGAREHRDAIDQIFNAIRERGEAK